MRRVDLYRLMRFYHQFNHFHARPPARALFKMLSVARFNNPALRIRKVVMV